MLSNGHNNSSCAFAGEIVSYLYGEVAGNEKSNFEAHLENCPVCADELTSFKFTRSSILEWRDEEFSKLETPVFNIPATGQEKHFSPNLNSAETTSWADKFRRLFSFNPAFAAGALGILIVCIGLVLFLLNSSNKNDIAEAKKELDKNLAQASVSPTAEIISKPEQVSVTDKDKKSSSPVTETKDAEGKVKLERQVPVNNTVVKVSNNVPKNNADNFASNLKEPKNDNKKTPSLEKRNVPKLTDIDEEEDDSIRLADLFAELDTK